MMPTAESPPNREDRPMSIELPRWTATIDGFDYEAEVAKVEAFHLGYEDHGLFTAEVRFGGLSWGQSLTAHALDEYDEGTKTRQGTAFGMDYVIGLVGAIGSPENAVGRRVVVLREKAYGPILGVAALRDDGSTGEPFIPRRLAEKHYPAQRVAASDA